MYRFVLKCANKKHFIMCVKVIIIHVIHIENFSIEIFYEIASGLLLSTANNNADTAKMICKL